MRFDLTDEQRLLQQTARAFFGASSDGHQLRRLYDEDRFGREVWDGMARQGWLSVLVDEAHGGLGLPLADLFPVLEAAGRATAPVPLIESGVVAPLALRLAEAALADRWLPRLAEGSALATAALFEEADVEEPPRISVSATRSGAGWTLDGRKALVPFGQEADLLLVLARTDPAQAGLRGLTLFAVPRETAGVSLTGVPHTDPTYRFAAATFSGAALPTDHALGPVGEAGEALRPAVRAARVAICAEALGGAERALEMAVAYAGQRVQFGRPIGSFQAIKHKLADMYAAVERMRGVAWAATSAVEDFDDPLVEIAKALCDDAYRFVTNEAVQVHGGIGFTWEHDVNFFYKRAIRYAQTLGTSRTLMYRVGVALASGRAFEAGAA